MNANDIAYRFVATRPMLAKTRHSCLYTLRGFDRFVLEHTRVGDGATVATLRTWLQHEAKRSPLTSVLTRMRLFARYVEWRTTARDGAHPLLELRAQCGRSLAPIVRALLADDYEGA